MQPAPRFRITYRFLHCNGERDNIMLNFRFDLVDTCHIDSCTFAQFYAGFAWNDAGFRQRFRSG